LSFGKKIVDETSDVLAEYFYHGYICELENILNDVCRHLKDLYRPKLTLEKCKNETHALILRVCRSSITATLRYSHLHSTVKQDAINELIYAASIAAFYITSAPDSNASNEIVGMDIHKSVALLPSQNEMTKSIVQTLFATHN
jgi:deoxycytidylate deaminase